MADEIDRDRLKLRAQAALALAGPQPPTGGGGGWGGNTLQDRAREVFGFEDYVDRGTVLPLGRTAEGDVEFAMPQVGVDMATSLLLPGHVLQGGAYTGDDVTRFALDLALPATGRGGVTKREFIDRAPSTEDLSSIASPMFKSARDSGAALNGDRYADFLGDLETRLIREGVDKMLHPKATAVFDAMTKRLGDNPTIADLMTMRRQIGIAANSTVPELADERRLAGIMRDQLDDMIDNMTDADLVAGTAAGVSDNLAKARSLWSRAKKSETIDDIIARAELQASGTENGLRIGFRQLLKDKKRLRGFTPAEVAAMKDVVNGGSLIKAMRTLGKLSFGTTGSNFLGGSIGIAAGGSIGNAIGGPLGGIVGGALAPLTGLMFQKAADASTRRAADFARALVASGGKLPNGGGLLFPMMQRYLPATAAAEFAPSGLLQDNRQPGGLLGQ